MTPAAAASRAGDRPDARTLPESDRSPLRAPTRGRLRVLVVDEPGIMREGVSALLDTVPEVAVIGSAPIGLEALQAASALDAEVIVLELPAGVRNSTRFVSDLRSHLAGVRLIVLTSQREAPVIDAVLRAGADGYVLKSDSRAELFAAVASVLAGKRFVSPSLRRDGLPLETPALADAARPSAAQEPDLTERELQVMRHIAAGRRTREIARLLSLSHKTIEKHRSSLMRKLGLRNATAVAAYAIMKGIAEE